MDAIVNRLAEIESAAAAIVKHAEEEKDELEQEMRRKQTKFDEELKAVTEQRLTEVSKQAESQVSAEKEQLKKNHESKILQLKKEYEQRGGAVCQGDFRTHQRGIAYGKYDKIQRSCY